LGRQTVAPSDYRDDADIWPQLVKLRDCLEDTLTERNLLPSCGVRLMPGELPDFAGADETAWVRLVNSFFVETFPNATSAKHVPASTEAAAVELTIVRCITVDAHGNPLKPEELREFTRVQMADRAALVAAVKCCKFDQVA